MQIINDFQAITKDFVMISVTEYKGKRTLEQLYDPVWRDNGNLLKGFFYDAVWKGSEKNLYLTTLERICVGSKLSWVRVEALDKVIPSVNTDDEAITLIKNWLSEKGINLEITSYRE
jgi:hypothetical protein